MTDHVDEHAEGYWQDDKFLKDGHKKGGKTTYYDHYLRKDPQRTDPFLRFLPKKPRAE